MVCDGSRRWRNSSRAPHAHGLLGARQAPGDRAGPLLRQQRALGERLLGPQVVQVPEQIVVERGAHPDKPLAVIDQQPDVELDAGQLGRREPLDALAQRRAGDGERVDAVGLAAITSGAALAGHQPGRDPDDAFAVDEQEPLEGRALSGRDPLHNVGRRRQGALPSFSRCAAAGSLGRRARRRPGLLVPLVATTGDPHKRRQPAVGPSRWRMRGARRARLRAPRPARGARSAAGYYGSV